MIAMLGVFVDTIIICSLTAFVILLTGAFESGHKGASMTSLAFSTGLYGHGGYIVSFGLILFAFTKRREWYLLAMVYRLEIMDVHIAVC